MTALLSEKARNAMLDQVPLGRPGQPEDVAAVVAFLASESASYLTGQVIHVSGGMYI
jgi:3-oxoacyl-[acyl-carrier protein] reductase